MDAYFVIKVLEESVKKNGEIQLTNKHLLNILRMADRWKQEAEEKNEMLDGSFEWWKD
jgi:hypothetical protein